MSVPNIAQLPVRRALQDLALLVQHIQLVLEHALFLHAARRHVHAVALTDADPTACSGDPALGIEQLAQFDDQRARRLSLFHASQCSSEHTQRRA